MVIIDFCWQVGGAGPADGLMVVYDARFRRYSMTQKLTVGGGCSLSLNSTNEDSSTLFSTMSLGKQVEQRCGGRPFQML